MKNLSYFENSIIHKTIIQYKAKKKEKKKKDCLKSNAKFTI